MNRPLVAVAAEEAMAERIGHAGLVPPATWPDMHGIEGS